MLFQSERFEYCGWFVVHNWVFFDLLIYFTLHLLLTESLLYSYVWCFFDFGTCLLHITGTPYGFCIVYSSPVLSYQQQQLWLLILRTRYISLSLSLSVCLWWYIRCTHLLFDALKVWTSKDKLDELLSTCHSIPYLVPSVPLLLGWWWLIV